MDERSASGAVRGLLVVLRVGLVLAAMGSCNAAMFFAWHRNVCGMAITHGPGKYADGSAEATRLSFYERLPSEQQFALARKHEAACVPRDARMGNVAALVTVLLVVSLFFGRFDARARSAGKLGKKG